jgi:outer membrane usher protein
MRTSRILFVALAATLAACASTPGTPRPVAVKAGEISRDYSSFNARVISEAGEIDHAFTTSLDPEAEPVTRLQSAYTHNLGDGEKLRIGDAVSSAGMWGSSVRYGGVQFGTRTGAREDVISDTEFASEGLAVLPTASDALFAAAGDSTATTVSAERAWRTGALTASDVRGRSVSIDGPIIAQTQLVEQGCGDFAVGAGKVRRDYAILSNEYGPVFANATVACSAPLGFTVEGHGEYLADDVAALGFGLARRVGPLGTASFAMAQSRAVAGEEGWLARVGFEHRNDLFSVALRKRMQSREFREAGALALADPIMERELASLGVNVAKRANLSLAYATQTTWNEARTNLIAVQQSLGVGRGSLSMSAGHSLEDNFGSSLFISYKRPLGGEKRRERSAIQEFDPVMLDQMSLQ